ncbi:hypothetical protein ACWD04_01960 [Streptomyces sp. NPDC002911]
MSSAPQVQTQEISDADLDNVSGGVFAGLAGEVSLETPLSAGISGAVGGNALGVAGLGSAATLSS